MTGLDIVLGALLLYGLVKGLWKGLFAELASLLALLAGIYAAVKFSGFVGKMLEGRVGDPKQASITAFAITFLAVVVGIFLLAKVFTKLADFSGLGLLNRVLGGIFGFLKAVLLLSVALNFFLKINVGNAFAEKETLNNSVFFYPVLEVSNTLFPILKEWFEDAK